MTEEQVEEKEPEVNWGILILKTKEHGTVLQNLDDQPGPDTIDDLYKELVLVVRNIEADHQAAVHANKMVQTMRQLQGVQESGIVTPPGVKV